MKILQLTKFYPPMSGGMESVVYELTEGLIARGGDIEVLCANSTATTKIDEGRYPVIRAASLGRLLNTSISPALVWNLLCRRKSYDIVHVHLPDPMTNLALFICRPSCQIVVHWHSDIVAQKRALKFYAPLQAWLLRRADAIIATSPPYAASSHWLAPFVSKVHTVPLGIRDVAIPRDDDVHARKVASLQHKYGGRRIVFSLGRMTHYKGFEILIEAAAALGPDVCVVIGGGGELLNSLQKKVRALHAEGKVYLIGRVPDEDIAAHFEASTIFCLPSLIRSEAFGVVLLEAMAHSLPIVATRISGSGVPWVNIEGETGINVEPGNSDALGEALNQLLANPALASKMGAAGRHRFESHFLAKRMVDETNMLYQELCAN
jgi:glycosyltransferase involved in cell wall biosynthesis